MKKNVQNKKTEILLSEKLLPMFWMQSLRFSVFRAFEPRTDLRDMRFAAAVFLKLRDFGVSGILYVFVYDFVRILRNIDRMLNYRFAQDFKPLKFSDAVFSEKYERDCISVFRNSRDFQKIRMLFTYEKNDICRFAIFFEQLFAGFKNFASFEFFAPEYELSNLEYDFSQIMQKAETFDFNMMKTSEDLGFTTDLKKYYLETLEFLLLRFKKTQNLLQNSESMTPVTQYSPNSEMLNELKHADLFIKKSVRTQKRLIQDIAINLTAVNLDEIKPDEHTQDFVEADDAFYYPQGGVSELTRKGSFETILPSELAFIDEKVDDTPKSPDLFTLRYAENEILYFQRDNGYIRRKQYAVNFVLWDFASFRCRLDGFDHGLDIYLESALYRFANLLIQFLDSQGLNLRFRWLFNNREQIIETPELFSIMFYEDEKLGIFESIKHEKPDEIVNCINASTHFDRWIIILPPIHVAPQFSDFASVYDDFNDKSRVHIVKFRKKVPLSEILPQKQYQNYTELRIPTEIEKDKQLRIFDDFVKLLFSIVI
ncbi:MAG: hypothetical protein K8S87_02610 [Planctomycetes bacterium]|nr:hypothetical protein [Planctomycetota bacterium]